MLINSQLRYDLFAKLVEVLYRGKSAHVGSCLSCMDLVMDIWLEQKRSQDFFILSKGHAAPSLYVTLNHLGVISDQELQTFYQDNSHLPAHTPNAFHEYIPFPTGSLGHGLSLSAGMAQGFGFDQPVSAETTRVYCIISDGECEEGQTWEAAQYIGKHQLRNVITIIDKNRWQLWGKTKDILGDGAASEKWQAFGFEVFECNGHDHRQITEAFTNIHASIDPRPKVLIAKTYKGFGLSWMEDTMESHHDLISDAQYPQALRDLQKKFDVHPS